MKLFDFDKFKFQIIEVTWFDPYDSSETYDFETEPIKEYYSTIGYCGGVQNDQVILGFNLDKSSGNFRGYGVIPLSLITRVRTFKENESHGKTY